MATLSVNKIPAYDADNAYTVTFAYTGSQCIFNKIDVINTKTNVTEYTHTTPNPTYSLNNVIPGGTLTNGNAYCCRVTAYYYSNTYSVTLDTPLEVGSIYYFKVADIGRSFSATSDAIEIVFDANTNVLTLDGVVVECEIGINGEEIVLSRDIASIESEKSNEWYCLKRPLFNFANLHVGQIIGNSSYDFQVDYEQADGEKLKEFFLIIYTQDESEFFNSDTRYPLTTLGYKCKPARRLYAGDYTFKVNGVYRTFNLATQTVRADAYLIYKVSSNTLTITDNGNTRTLVVSSGKTGTELDFNIAVQDPVVNVANLADDSVYYAKLIGTTINGYNLETDRIQFSINFIKPSVYGVIQVENMRNAGTVKVASNISAVVGKSDDPNLEYVNGISVDLKDGKVVDFDGGYDVSGNGFVMKATIINPDYNVENIQFNTLANKYSVTFYNTPVNNKTDKVFAVLRQQNTVVPNFYLMSNYIDTPSEDDEIFVNVKYDGSFYEFNITNIGVVN